MRGQCCVKGWSAGSAWTVQRRTAPRYILLSYIGQWQYHSTTTLLVLVLCPLPPPPAAVSVCARCRWRWPWAVESCSSSPWWAVRCTVPSPTRPTRSGSTELSSQVVQGGGEGGTTHHTDIYCLFERIRTVDLHIMNLVPWHTLPTPSLCLERPLPPTSAHPGVCP